MKRKRAVTTNKETMKSKRAKISIPEEIIFLLLVELPAKSLLRFRCVSKLWRSIIDDPFFITSHHNRSRTRPGGTTILVQQKPSSGSNLHNFLSIEPEGGSAFKFQSLMPNSSCRFFQSVNGLICLGNIVWNPTTRETITLPPLPPLDTDLAGDPLVSSYTRSLLGFAPSTKEYKVLSIRRINVKRILIFRTPRTSKRIAECYVLTLGTNHWRKIDLFPDKLNESVIEEVCFVKGNIYCWGANCGLVAFDVANENFKCISLPDTTMQLGFIMPVEESLSLIDPTIENIWISDDTSHWKHDRIPRIISDKFKGKKRVNVPSIPFFSTPVGTIHTGEILVRSVFSVVEDFERLFYYNLEEKSWKSFRCSGLRAISGTFFTKHVECLFKLK